MPYTHIRKSDFVILSAAVLLALAFCVVPRLPFHTALGAYCEITCGGETTRYPLSENRTVTCTHGGYTLTVQIAHGAVSVTSADCPDRVCVKTGEISAPASVIVCVPAEMVIRIVGTEAEEADYVAG